MKVAVSMFEKLLVSLIIFVFCIVVLVQIFVNNDVLGTIKANESGTPVSFEQSSTYSPKGNIKLRLSSSTEVSLLLNGEVVEFSDVDSQLFDLEVYDGDVLEVKNNQDELVTISIISTSNELTNPIEGNKIECNKGITYLFKVKSEKIS